MRNASSCEKSDTFISTLQKYYLLNIKNDNILYIMLLTKSNELKNK